MAEQPGSDPDGLRYAAAAAAADPDDQHSVHLHGLATSRFGFALRASGGIILLSILLSLLTLPTFTSDRLLIAVFGGFFLGAGIGLSIRGGGVIDGTEVLALYISRKTGLTIGDFILVINILIFLTAAWLINLESAMYSTLTYLIASRTVDFLFMVSKNIPV